jgi:hypothetical protein
MTRWYWAISCDNTVDNPLVVDAADLGIDPQNLAVGHSLESWSELARLRTTKPENDGMPDDVLQNHLGLPVYSSRLRAALAGAEIRGIQYLPVRLFRPNGQEVAGFSIANITERREALDRSSSDYDVFPDDYFLSDRRGKVRGIRRVVLRAKALAGCDSARLDEFPSSVYVSERFKNVFEAGRYTGYSFREVLTS